MRGSTLPTLHATIQHVLTILDPHSAFVATYAPNRGPRENAIPTDRNAVKPNELVGVVTSLPALLPPPELFCFRSVV